MAATSSAVSSKSKMARFSAIRPGFADFGIATRPSWMCQRSTIWVADLPYFSPSPTTAGSERRSSPEPPIGLHDSVTIPCSLSKARLVSRVLYGLSWIWFTSGVTPVSSITWRRWVGLKLETPMALIDPSSSSAASPRTASEKRPWSGFGQCTISRSM